jgi:hypothetical protein
MMRATIRRRAIGLMLLVGLTAGTGCQTADAVRDGVYQGISDTVSTIIMSLLLPEEVE